MTVSTPGDLLNFSVGVQEIDDEHQVLFDCLDAIIISLNTTFCRSQSFEALEKLTEYSRTHFRVEECLMRVVGYPELEAHKRQHAFFVQKLDALRSKILTDDISTEMVSFLTEWLLEHINLSDMRYVTFVSRTYRPEN